MSLAAEALPKLPRKLATNVALHVVNGLLPFVTVPYLVRTLGLATYGQIGVALALNQYLLLVSEFGFTLSASAEVARGQYSRRDLGRLYSDVQFAKLALMLLNLFILFVLVRYVAFFAEQESLIYIGFAIVVGAFVNPTWLFLGKEAMDRMLVLTIVPRLLAIPAVFILVKDPGDSALALGTQSLPIVLTGLTATAYAYRHGWIEFQKPMVGRSLYQLRRAWPLFLSSVSTSLYTSSTPLILGFFAGNAAVGAFVAADKIRVAAQSLITPVGQVVFPRVNALIRIDITLALKAMQRTLGLQGAVHLLVSIFILAFAPELVSIAYLTAALESTSVLRTLAPLVFIVGLNAVLGTHIMLSLGMQIVFSRILVIGALWHVVILSFAAKFFGAVGAGVTLLSTEFGIMCLMLFALGRTSALRVGIQEPTSVLHAVLARRP